mmetsp:Transcript_16224/g.35173  ORF Transcript_16224/g.35173 Transcript_16224/m.35173 type:complete len:203 (-) Transcript_16224:1241-1849(-)
MDSGTVASTTSPYKRASKYPANPCNWTPSAIPKLKHSVRSKPSEELALVLTSGNEPEASVDLDERVGVAADRGRTNSKHGCAGDTACARWNATEYGRSHLERAPPCEVEPKPRSSAASFGLVTGAIKLVTLLGITTQSSFITRAIESTYSGSNSLSPKEPIMSATTRSALDAVSHARGLLCTTTTLDHLLSTTMFLRATRAF